MPGSALASRPSSVTSRATRSSRWGPSPKPAKTKRKVMYSVRTVDEPEVCQMRFAPEPSAHASNGWQMNCDSLKSRISTLFNSYTLSDITFTIEPEYEIPAHRFVLGIASPVFFQQLHSEGAQDVPEQQGRRASEVSATTCYFSGDQESLPNRSTEIPIAGVPYLVFFEFLQYIYTDVMELTLENVVPLLYLADDYKVAGMHDRCLEFLRSEIVPSSAFRVLRIAQTLLLKVLINVWQSQVEQRKETERYRQLTLAERRALAGGDDASSVHGTSTAGRRISALTTTGSGILDGSSRCTTPAYSKDDSPTSRSSPVRTKAPGLSNKRSEDTSSTMFRSAKLAPELMRFTEDISLACWRCIQVETEAAISCDDMWQQDVRTLRQVLRQDKCTVPEIELFRAVVEWAERQCQRRGLAPTIDNKRQVLEPGTLLLIRFPTMTAEQFEWEVVPTGLLGHADVQEILHDMSGFSIALHYNREPRCGIVLDGGQRRSPDPSSRSAMSATPSGRCSSRGPRQVYEAAKDDPLDAMLGAQMLRNHLSSRAGDHDDAQGLEDASRASSPGAAEAGPRLPPISSPSPPPSTAAPSRPASGRSSPWSRRPASGRSSPWRPPSRMPSYQSVLGHTVAPEPSPGSGLIGDVRPRSAKPDDFARLAPGLYRFRDEQLVELWAERGVVMTKNHGPNGQLARMDTDAEHDEDALRARLGIGDAPPVGRGVPLVSFLCQQ